MGLVFKPVKCKTLSVCGGKASKMDFTLLDSSNSCVTLKSLQEEPHKFLGQTLTLRNSVKDHFNFLHEIVENKLKHLDDTAVRSEYKVATYQCPASLGFTERVKLELFCMHNN